jgi:hypothetical protein
MTLTSLLVPTYTQMLQTLSGLLQKAQAQFAETGAEELLAGRLAPDMFPLSSQVSFACLQAQEGIFRLRGLPLPDSATRLASEGQNAGDKPGSLVEAQARIAETLALLFEVDDGSLDASIGRPVTLELPTGMIFDMTGEQYARDWALPQFYFHLVTAYAILRNHGVDLGKADYVPHMFPYLRPGSMPQR